MQFLLRQGDVWLALLGIVARQSSKHKLGYGAGQCKYAFSELPDAEFLRIAQIDRASEIIRAVHQFHHSVDKVIDVTE